MIDEPLINAGQKARYRVDLLTLWVPRRRRVIIWTWADRPDGRGSHVTYLELLTRPGSADCVAQRANSTILPRQQNQFTQTVRSCFRPCTLSVLHTSHTQWTPSSPPSTASPPTPSAQPPPCARPATPPRHLDPPNADGVVGLLIVEPQTHPADIPQCTRAASARPRARPLPSTSICAAQTREFLARMTCAMQFRSH